MKKLSLEQMEVIEGGGFVDGACAVLGATDAGIALRSVIKGAAVRLIPGAGQVLAVATVACFTYYWLR